LNGKSFYEYVAAVKIVRQGFILNTPGADDLIALHQANDGEETGSSGGILHYGFQLEDKAQLDNAIEQVIAAGGSLKKAWRLWSGFAFRLCPRSGWL